MTAGPVEREHVLRAEPLSERVLRDQRLQLADDVAMAAEREVGLDPPFERAEAQLLEPRRLVRCEGLRELGERRPAPERERARRAAASPAGLLLGERPRGRRRRSARSGAGRARRPRPRARSRARASSRGSGSAFRSCETWICTIFAPTPARPRPRGRRRSARGRPCGSRSAAGPRAAPAACPPTSHRRRLTLRAGREAEILDAGRRYHGSSTSAAMEACGTVLTDSRVQRCPPLRLGRWPAGSRRGGAAGWGWRARGRRRRRAADHGAERGVAAGARAAPPRTSRRSSRTASWRRGVAIAAGRTSGDCRVRSALETNVRAPATKRPPPRRAPR